MSEYFKVEVYVRGHKSGTTYDNAVRVPRLPTKGECPHINTVTTKVSQKKAKALATFEDDIRSQIHDGAVKEAFPNYGDGGYAGGGQVKAIGLIDLEEEKNMWIDARNFGDVVKMLPEDEKWVNGKDVRYVLEIRVKDGQGLK